MVDCEWVLTCPVLLLPAAAARHMTGHADGLCQQHSAGLVPPSSATAGRDLGQSADGKWVGKVPKTLNPNPQTPEPQP